MAFTHLHVHTHYSMLNGYSTAKEIFKAVSDHKMQGLAITDYGTMAGVPEFLNQSRSYPEIKPIIGCEFRITDHFDHTLKDWKHRECYNIVLLAKNAVGYANLVKLCSIANVEGFYFKPRISHTLLQEHHEGLICLSGSLGGEISKALLGDDYYKAREIATWYKDVFGDDFYLEITLHPSTEECCVSQFDNIQALKTLQQEVEADQKRVAKGLLALSKELGIKVVATNDVHFAKKEDAIADDILTTFITDASINDPQRIRHTHLEYLKSEVEMLALFPNHPEVIENTSEILDKVEKFDITTTDFDEYYPEQKLHEEFSLWGGGSDKFFAHLKAEFGPESVAGIVNFKRMGEKEALNRVAKAYSLSFRDLLENWGNPGFNGRIDEVRRISSDLKGRIFSASIQKGQWLVSPGRNIMDIVPCATFLHPQTKEPILCSQYESDAKELSGLVMVK